MELIFGNCSSLTSLNLSNFNTSSVNNMRRMFYGSSSLLSLDLINFDTSKVTSTEEMFYNCSSLIAINLNNFNTSSLTIMNKMFDYCSEYLIYCINSSSLKGEISSQLSNFNNNCSNACFLEHHLIIAEERKCIVVCNYGNYKYEYNNICYETCPNGTYISQTNNNKCLDLINQDENYTNYTNYIESPNFIINFTEYIHSTLEETYNISIIETTEKCLNKCKACTNESTYYNLCISCNIEKHYYSKFNEYFKSTTFLDCYDIEPQGYYLNKENNIYMPCFTKLNNSDKCEECYNTSNNLNYLKCFEKCIYNYKNCISNDKGQITKEINLDILNNNLDINIYSYEITSKVNVLQNTYKNSTIIEISSELRSALFKEFNLNEEKDKIYILILDYISNNTNFVTNDYKMNFSNFSVKIKKRIKSIK